MKHWPSGLGGWTRCTITALESYVNAGLYDGYGNGRHRDMSERAINRVRFKIKWWRFSGCWKNPLPGTYPIKPLPSRVRVIE